MESQTRNHFRIEYPSRDRPKIKVGDESFTVLNVSEGGMLFEFKGPAEELEIENDLRGTIAFRNEEKIQVEGTVVRVEDNRVAVQLSKGIPLGRIMAEQLYLLKKFGTIKVPGSSD